MRNLCVAGRIDKALVKSRISEVITGCSCLFEMGLILVSFCIALAGLPESQFNLLMMALT